MIRKDPEAVLSDADHSLKQEQHRLDPHQVKQLVADYLSGQSVIRLAQQQNALSVPEGIFASILDSNIDLLRLGVDVPT